MNRLASLAAVAALLAGCANWSGYQAEQNAKYVGKPVDSMLREWGAPIGAVELTTGGWFYEFQYFRGSYECKAKAWTNPARIVSEVRVSGQNGCVL